MNKEDLKEIALDILFSIEQLRDSSTTISEAIELVENSDDLFENYSKHKKNFEDLSEIEKEKYKELAIESINSYSSTNSNFDKITKEHQQKLNSLEEQPRIDMESIQDKFKDIQEHLKSEVDKANEEIKRLRQKVKHLQEESNLDPLTKTLNRRALKKYLSNVCNKQNFRHELHLLVIDLDDFKLINDKYGHIAGDKILIFISNMLKHILRDGDKIFRYGGEEFIIILNRISKEQCETITKRLISQISSNKLLYKGESIKVTVSIGSTTFKVGDTPESLIHRADEALYEAKRTGKNKHIIKE